MSKIGEEGVRWSVLILITFTSSVSLGQSSQICPKSFVPIGKKCYHFSKDEAIWHDAHFNCSKINSTLATVTTAHQEFLMRRYLTRWQDGQSERWLGGRFNDKLGRWEWGQNGKALAFKGFSRMNAKDRKWAWHCIVVDPRRQYKWGARRCYSKRPYICQTSGFRVKNFKRKCQKELCSNRRKSLGKIAPGFLVKKPVKKYKPYQLSTFVCPPHMILVGRKCYFFSTEKVDWITAYWACRDNHTKLAQIMTRIQDNILRGFLNGNFTEKHERWTEGIYDWGQNKWKWAMSGRTMKYKNFAPQVLENKSHIHHVVTMDPQYGHMWNSRNRLEKKHYICQAKAKSVVKVVKPYKINPPDATVVIETDNSNDSTVGLTNRNSNKFGTTENYPFYQKNDVLADKYVYN